MTNEEFRTLRKNAGLSVAVLAKIAVLTRQEIQRYVDILARKSHDSGDI